MARCPTCDSPDPMRHPAMQFEGEVQICKDAYHPITRHTVTDDMIRDYTREHWRDPWMDGGPGKGTVNDAAIILFSSTTSHEGAMRIREEFARLINVHLTASGSK